MMGALLSAGREGGGLSAPAMTIIAMLLLMLPYLIKRYTGKSVTDLFRLSVILGAFEKLADKLRARVPGGGVLLRKAGIQDDGKNSGKGTKSRTAGKDAAGGGPEDAGGEAQDVSGKDTAGGEASGDSPDKVKEEFRSRTREKRRAGNMQNDYLQAIARIFNFARKKRLFEIVPANIQHGGRISDLAAIFVTKSRAVGVAAYSFDGKIICRRDGGAWMRETDDGEEQIGCLCTETSAQDGIVRDALNVSGLGGIPYETVMLFTSSQAELAGDRPGNAFGTEELFKWLETKQDLEDGSLDPKETGKRIAALKASKRR